ncbi:MAG: hypothetical protein V1802_00955 [Candidatus Aenigmatarchaeota archaeon]
MKIPFKFDMPLMVLYFLGLVLIIVFFSEMWSVAFAVIIVLLISITQKMYFENKFTGFEKKFNNNAVIDKILSQINNIGQVLETSIIEFKRNTYTMSAKMQDVKQELKNEYTEEIGSRYSDLLKKIFDTETRVDEIKKNISKTTKNKNAVSTKTLAKKIKNLKEELKKEYAEDIGSRYNDILTKIFETEMKLDDVKKNLGIAYGSLDERVRSLEDKNMVEGKNIDNMSL